MLKARPFPLPPTKWWFRVEVSMSRRMISLLAALTVVACLVALPAARAGDASHARIVRVSYTMGEVQVSSDGSQAGWHNAIANTPLREGNSLSTGDGRAEIEFETGAVAWMAGDTVLGFPELALEDGGKITQLEVRQGTATFYVKPGKHDQFEVRAGQLTIESQEATRFRVDVFADGAAVSVLRGSAQVTSRGSSRRLGSNQTLAVRDDVTGDGAVTSNPKGDAWDRWVSQRFSSVEGARNDATDYLNAPVGYGMADLSFYGGWLNVPGYGLGWQPYGIGAAWSPFFNGYWYGMGGFGPAWISYEPWGWLPYHYGGWVFAPAFGWVWVPGTFGAWNPGTVFWTTTPTGRGWVPRAPNEYLTGSPANLSRGVITNTTGGILTGSANTVLRGAAIGKLLVTGEWSGEAHLDTALEQGRTQTVATGGAAKSVHGPQRMPQSGAPRITTAGLVAGRVQVYRPPAPMGGPGGGNGSSGGGHYGGATSGSGGSHGEPAPSRGSAGPSSGGAAPSHGKP